MKKGKFEILPHTADLRLKVTGKTLKDLFEQAVFGLSDILKSGECSTLNVEHSTTSTYDVEVEVAEVDKTILLIDFLSEVLTVSYEEKTVFCKAEFSKLTDTKLQAKVFGNRVNGFDEDIKAVTYHEAKIVKNKEGDFEVIIIFDI